MDPSALKSSEVDSVSSPISSSIASVPDGENQTLTNSPTKTEEPKQNPHAQNPSSSPAGSEPIQILLVQAPDPLNSQPVNPDHDLQQSETEDPDDQEGMSLSPSRLPLVSGANVDEEPSSRSIRRPSQKRRGRLGKKKLENREKRSQALALSMKSVPFVPSKALDFSKHEESLRKLGLWDFAHLEFDRKVRNDLLAQLIISYDDKKRASYVDSVRILVNQTDMARALKLPCKKLADFGEIDWPVDFIPFIDAFVSSWMLLHEDPWMLPPSEVLQWTAMIKDGHPEKIDWARVMWFMVKRELLKGSQLVSCYYASHLQQLIKYQKEGLLKEKSPAEVEEILVLKDDYEDEVSHGEETEMNVENAPAIVEDGTGNVQSDVKMAENLASVGDVGDVGTLGSGDGTTDNAVQVENEKTCGDQVENLVVVTSDHEDSLNTIDDHVKNLNILVTAVDQVEKIETVDVDRVENLETTAAVDHVEDLAMAAVDHVENLKPAVVDNVENLETAADHVENLKPAVADHVENVETASVDHVENMETSAVDHAENLETAVVNHVENLKPTVFDHVENLEMAAADHVEHQEITSHAENLGSTGDAVENLENAGAHLENLESTDDPVENLGSTAIDHVEYLQLIDEHVENLEPTNDVEDMNIDVDHVEDNKEAVTTMEDINTEAEIVIPDDDAAEIQETGCNDLIDFEVCKVDPWDLSSKDPEQQHFLQHCTMSEPKLHEHQENNTHLAEELDDDDDEDDEPAQGFGLSSTHLIQSIDSSQIPYFGGPSSIFGNSSKRDLDLDPEISTHKRMRTEPPEFEFCIDQMQQWIEKSKQAYLTTQQTTMSQQQMLFNELGSKEHLIQQLKMNNDELQRRRQAEMSRYENELYAMNSVIDGYRKALKSTQKEFAEYRKRLPLPIEPLYKDAGEGGVVKSVAELERERLKREEKEKAAKIMVERFEKVWEIKFEGLMVETEKVEARLTETVKGVELLRETMEKKKGSEMVS